MFEGVSVAVVTPFRGDSPDEDGFRGLVDRLIEEGVDGLVVTGSTGEAATLLPDERREVVRWAVEQARKRVFVVAGTGTNSTRDSIRFSLDARSAGADGVMIVTPYYNKPTPDGLEAHFRAVSEAVNLPIVAYNVPSRTGYNMTPAVAARIAAVPGVVALKEASGSVDQAIDIRLAAPDLTLLSGEDSLTLPLAAVGAKGIISVAGHLTARLLKEMLAAFATGHTERARELHEASIPVTRAMFLESNPGPVKYALSRLGWIRNELRPPLAPVRPETAREIDRVLEARGFRLN